MGKWQYAAVVQVEYIADGSPKEFEGELKSIRGKWTLLYDPSESFHRVNYESGQVNLQRSVRINNAVKKKFDERKKFHASFQLTQPSKRSPQQQRKLNNRLSKIRQGVVSEFVKQIDNYSTEHVICTGISAIDLVNKAADLGWETTGQVPGYPGPTGVTMMRRKVD